MNGSTYQSYENAKELNYVCVGHRVETAHQGVQNGNERRDNDRSMNINVNNHTDGGSWKKANKRMTMVEVLKWISPHMQTHIVSSVTANIFPCAIRNVLDYNR